MVNAIWQSTIVDQSGNVLPEAEVEVVNESTGLSAPLFTTRTGTTKSNPFFADANGFAQFYAAPGLYRITATSSGTGTTMTWRYVRLIEVGTAFDQIPLNADIVYPVATVAALRALTGISVGQKFQLDGHTNQGLGSGPLTATKLHTTETDNNGTLFVVDGVVIERELNGYVTPEMFGCTGNIDDCISEIASTGLDICINSDFTYSQDIQLDSDSFSIYGSGSLTAELGSGADIIITGDNVTLSVPVYGNENKTSEITSVSGTNIINVTDGSIFNVSDQVSVITDDSFHRVLWVGVVDSISSNQLTVSDNTIDGSFSDIAPTDTLSIINSSQWHGEVLFTGCNNPKVTTGFSGSERDLRFENCNNLTHDNLTLKYANLVYVFCFESNAGDIVSHNSRFYGRTIQASKGGKFGKLYCVNPLFSGNVVKGLHDCTIDDVFVNGAPVHSWQYVDYPGSLPSSVNPNLQSDLLNSNVIAGDLITLNGNFIANIKSMESVIFDDISSTGAYKSLFLDTAWGSFVCDTLRIKDHNTGGASRTENSSAAFWAQNGEDITIRSMSIDGARTSSTNGHTYISGISNNVNISELSSSDSDSYFNIVSSGDVEIGNLSSKESTNGFQAHRFENNNSLTINSIIGSESVNSNMDRSVLVTNVSDNVKIGGATIEYAGSITPTDGVRIMSSGNSIRIRDITVKTTGTAACTNAVRSTGNCDDISIFGTKAGAGVTNAVLVSNVADYLQVNMTQGTIVDSSTATNKDVTTGNL